MRTRIEIIPFPNNVFLFTFGFVQTSFGLIFTGFVNGSICVLEFVKEEILPERWCQIVGCEEKHIVLRDDSFSNTFIPSLFDSEEHPEPIFIALKGTPFQQKVWETLLQVSFGTVLSYSGLASLMQRESAVRAVASAVARNPISILIPCHRIVRSDGTIGKYRWGSERKKALINWEKEVYDVFN